MADAPSPLSLDWPLEVARTIVRLLTEKDSSEEIAKFVSAFVSMGHGSYFLDHGAAYDDFKKRVKALFDKAVLEVATPLATIASGAFAVPLSGGEVAAVAAGSAGTGTRDSAGAKLVAHILTAFDQDAVAAGYLKREAGQEERVNFERFVGINWQLQVADMLAEFAGNALPWGLGGGFQKIGEGLQKMLGLEDAQEEILQPLMEKFITDGLNKQFNRKLLNVDLTPSDAIAAGIRGYISPAIMHQILNNEGIRNDARPILEKMAGKNLTQSDLQDLYNWGAMTQGQVEQSFKENGYLPEDATTKTSLVVADRLRKLVGQLENVMQQQAVRSLIPEGEYEGFLRAQAYHGDEINVMLDIVRRQKTMAPAGTKKHITGSFNITPERVKEGASAIIKWNIRNADSITITDLGSVGPRGEQPLEVPRSRTYELHATNDIGDDETFYAYVEVRGQPEVKPPTATLTLSPRDGQIASLRELRWSTTKAESVTLDGVPVALDGVQFVTPVLPTFYTLRATNAAGTVTTQDVALVSLPELPGDLLNRPKVSFSVSPLVIDVDQPRVEIKWDVEKSDSQSLTFPDGHTISTDQHGARIEIMGASGIFTFTASNVFGRTIKQEAVLFKGEPFPTP